MMARDPQEANINVVVRVRPRNQKEIRENSPITVTTNGIRGRELHVKANQGESSTKTYNFDKVFGPDAGQNMLFDEVVSPMLEEVQTNVFWLNLTETYAGEMFRYFWGTIAQSSHMVSQIRNKQMRIRELIIGRYLPQTGTGKTYTMEGDLTTVRGEHAGIIPRTLYSLFDTLEASEVGEYFVRVSFIELYNEELKDLLSAEEDFRKLRIYEDYNRKGSVVIQGVEETLVKNAADVISVLQRGSHKRQTAATKMNEVSSRSHCIFTITVHIKEITPQGEELVKIGKLNLVDLAGSENIGRSGAENRRAKEAGMINQSLLTLGRVINALVDRSPHIPYRESGRTKTCIVAAVSPAKCNIEETMSTLDYAHRAKNIRNKPEVNQRMTKRALLRDYEDQIQRLKADLQATQAKNGVYLTHESYAQLVGDNSSGKDRVDELTKTIAAKEHDFKHLNTQLQQNLDLLDKTTAERDQTRTDLEAKRKELDELFTELKRMQQLHAEQQLLTSAHATTEKQLDKVAAGLVVTLKRSISDVEGLHDKLERKTSLEVENQQIFRDFQSELLQQMQELDENISRMGTNSSTFLSSFGQDMESFARTQMTMVQDSLSALNSQLDIFVHSGTATKDDVNTFNGNLSMALKDIRARVDALQSDFSVCNGKSMSMQQQLFASHRELIAQHQSQMEEWNSAMREKISGVSQTFAKYVTAEAGQHAERQQIIEARLLAEIEHLKVRNADLQSQLLSAKASADTDTDTLLSQITQLVSSYKSERHRVLDTIGEYASIATDEGSIRLEGAGAELRELEEDSATQRNHFVQQINADIKSLDETVEEEKETVATTIKGIFEQTTIMDDTRQDSAGQKQKLVDEACMTVKSSHDAVANEISKHHESQILALSNLHDSGKSLHTLAESQHTSYGQAVNQTLEKWHSCTQSQRNLASQSFNGLGQQISLAKERITDNSLTTDDLTGKTPQRQSFRYVTSWHRTRSHADILREYRENGRVMSPTSTPRSYEEALESDASDTEMSSMTSADKENESQMGTPRPTSKLPRTKSRIGRNAFLPGSIINGEGPDSPFKSLDNV
ncbi:hypothetical protein DFS34DRAFT_651958 [Phlyctochytrium arcticum]|nr:hypothetical protein DFS34DRAFT_651958 [Phlyctochytrium arcticum]